MKIPLIIQGAILREINVGENLMKFFASFLFAEPPLELLLDSLDKGPLPFGVYCKSSSLETGVVLCAKNW